MYMGAPAPGAPGGYYATYSMQECATRVNYKTTNHGYTLHNHKKQASNNINDEHYTQAGVQLISILSAYLHKIRLSFFRMGPNLECTSH